MKTLTSIGAMACCALFLGSVAIAQDRNQLLDAVRQFENADHDGNKALSWEEFRNYVGQMFHTADHDENGIIQGDEHPPAFDASGKPVVAPDLTIEAFNAEIRRAFLKADKDKSGDLSYAEYAGKS
jgi:hypothetical protein